MPDYNKTNSSMLSIAAAGLPGNLVMAWILGQKRHDLNMKSAWLHVLGDTVSSSGVIIAGTRVIREALWIILCRGLKDFERGSSLSTVLLK
ncbi:MAG: hypothetical protein HZA15_17570 [Nitrospirae bacterium]|nr:hypothetical protein [Nitrospirota bacterium]